MRLSEALARNFSSRVRDRGREYFIQKRVRLLGVNEDQTLSFSVRGTQSYHVQLDLDLHKDRYAAASCDCPYDSGLCKHVWAVILQVEQDYIIPELKRSMFLEEFYGDDDWEDVDTEYEPPSRAVAKTLKRKDGKRPPSEPAWSRVVSQVARDQHLDSNDYQRSSEAGLTLAPMYVVLNPHEHQNEFVLGLMQQKPTATGRMGKPKKLSVTPLDVPRLATDLDRQIVLMLIGAGQPDYGYYGGGYFNSSRETRWLIPAPTRESMFKLLARSDRVYCTFPDAEGPVPLTVDDGPAWNFELAIEPTQAEQGQIVAQLSRPDAVRNVSEVSGFVHGRPGMVILDGKLSRVNWHDSFDWIVPLREHGAVTISKADHLHLVEKLGKLKACPPVRWPAGWQVAELTDITPQAELTLGRDRYSPSRFLAARVQFHYDGLAVKAQQPGTILVDAQNQRQIRRDRDRERQLYASLPSLGFEPYSYDGDYRLPAKRMPETVRILMQAGWLVVAENKLLRSPGEFKIDVTSGIDWFELHGQVSFGDQEVSLPQILDALRKGQQFVRLSDGSMGMLPEEWLARHIPLLDLGKIEDGHIRFRRTQVGIVDALLTQLPEARFDESLTTARRRLSEFTGIRPQAAPDGFVGELRHYQQEGLGWLTFLNGLSWGGCLADDMGLGKTVQALALLVDRKRQNKAAPTLIVMPKSLVFNWMREADRFAPQLAILDYTGNKRKSLHDQFARADLVLTTYGTLRRDIEWLSKQRLDYAILDEAQAIKNPSSLSAKCARLLQAQHRLVMTGTPVENHLGDLWSLFEFLNPGMLGGAAAFKVAFGTSGPNGNGDGANSHLPSLQRILRPFILRRTKEQVAPELPERNEQTIECVMPPKQAALYAEMRDYYRQSLLGRVAKQGLARSKVYVLEALLRLRQAACHPGLIDKHKHTFESAKMESLMPMLTELLDGGHKALVFSQFTSFLDIVRRRLDVEGIKYEYLDGKTRNRQACVDRFQSDPTSSLFLISIKAGGTGLNLTAADYVFILDPWWNPAVEAQAIDRTHRIGQNRRVIAYRLIARDTVESKILQLQQSKRDLAGAIITQSNSLIQDLTREDLEVLLS